MIGALNAGGYTRLLIVYFILGTGGGIVVTGANALAGALDHTRRGSALNFLNLFFGVGGSITRYVGIENIDRQYSAIPLPV